jgi:general transcription factor IIIA
MHKNAEKLYKCPHEGCQKAYSLRMYLSSHLTKVHNAVHNIPSDVSTEATQNAPKHEITYEDKAKTTTQNIVWTCEYEGCQKVFRTKNNLRRHAKIHDQAQKKFKCTFENCEAEFCRREHLSNHMNAHDTQNMIKCDFPGTKSIRLLYINNKMLRNFFKRL